MSDGRRTFLWVVIGGGAFFVFLLAIFSLVYYTVRNQTRTEVVRAGSGGKIAVVDLEGVIITPKQTVKQLKKFADDSSVKAIILHVNSPGGGVAASEEIYREVRRIRDDKKKEIVASIETVGASGAYYIAAGTKKIYANNGSIVGSIGVIMEWVNYQDLLKWAKMKNVVIKTGEFKDTGNPARELTPAEQQYLQGLAQNMLGQFISSVADGRKMKQEDIKAIADGKVWTGEEAKNLKLVDEIGDFEAVVQATAKDVGIKGDPTLVRAEKEKRNLMDLLFGDVSEIWPDPGKLLQQHPGFYYLWK
ncbi:MAG TPA: signal peptide peptidase SppA [Terriglobales bacterium]|nr:signal peptide peptidase SppA [Terriglobales bacterium]